MKLQLHIHDIKTRPVERVSNQQVLLRVHAHKTDIADDGKGVWLFDADHKRVGFIAIRHGVESITCMGLSNITVP